MPKDNNHNKELKCSECGGRLELRQSKDAQGVTYGYYSCTDCGYEFLDKKQFLDAVEDYRKMKKYNVRVSRWGSSLGMRIPKELAQKEDIDESSELVIIPEETGFKIMKA